MRYLRTLPEVYWKPNNKKTQAKHFDAGSLLKTVRAVYP